MQQLAVELYLCVACVLYAIFFTKINAFTDSYSLVESVRYPKKLEGGIQKEHYSVIFF